MKISIIGTGYVGLVTGACFADHGNHVICADIAADKIKALKTGKVPFFEPSLENLVQRNAKEHRLEFSDNLAAAIKDAHIHFLCVGTPYNEKLGTLDTTPLEQAALTVAQAATANDIIIVKSTVPVGTTAKVQALVRKAVNKPLHIAMNPEFLKEGNAVEDFMKPDRVVLGVEDEQGDAAKTLSELYAPFVRTGNPILLMDHNSAEMVKLASNGYLATRISYINEVANICEVFGANVGKVRLGMGHDNRIGHRYLFPGIGYGGSCFPKDIQAIMKMGEQYPFGARILNAVHQVNLNQRTHFVDKLKREFAGNLKGKCFAMWGLAFKPNTDDVRDAPSIDVIQALLDSGAKVQVYDPEAIANIKAIFGSKITYCEDNYSCLEGSDALCLMTEWGVFRNPDFARMKSLMRQALIVDGRNLYSESELKSLGFKYLYMGQPNPGRAA